MSCNMEVCIKDKMPSNSDVSLNGYTESMDECVPKEIPAFTTLSSDTVISSVQDCCLPIIKFSTLFKLKEIDKRAMVEWFMRYGLISSSYICPKCGMPMKLAQDAAISEGYLWRCRVLGQSNKHSVRRSVRKGSVFSERLLSLTDILVYIHCWVHKVPTEWIMLEMGCSINTVVEWGNICRSICVEFCARDDYKIGGKNKVIEIIGGKFETQKCKKALVKDSWVFAGVEDIYGEKSFIRLVEKCEKKSFLEVIKSSVFPETTIVSEFCETFNCLEDEDFLNLAVEYSYKFENFNGSKHREKYWVRIRKAIPHNSMKDVMKDGVFDKRLGELLWRKRNSGAYDKIGKFILAVKTVFPPSNQDD